MREKPTLSDHRVENIIGNLLRIGVIVAASIVAAGGAFYLYRRAGVISNYGSFRGEPAFLEHIGSVLAAATSLRADAVIQLGLLVLIAVPIFRVAVSIIAFLLKRDWLYSVVTAIVLAVLLFALLGGMV
ncbi:MAG: DUF1634 domain-containing protein [Spirochaetia bacterium]